MEERRRYQRYTVDKGVNTPEHFRVTVAGQPVRLVNFSLGGLYVLSKEPFSPGEVDVSVSFQHRGKIDLVGKVVKVTKEGKLWGAGIDLSGTYIPTALKKA